MRQLNKLQFFSLWFCLAYFGIALFIIGGRASFGVLRLASEYREAQVPREVLMNIADSAARDFRLHSLLISVGCIMLGSLAVWVSGSRKA